MNKKEARAILACQATIDKAIEVCLAQLNEQDRDWAESYWAGHIRQSIGGSAYGSMPISQAEDALED